ncbi:MAG: FadR family transcriptional regulator [Spirochaetia bacterium]|nr:FadR family transcriptional regulator [Spirochaetia bacterium]
MNNIDWFSNPVNKGPVSRIVLERIKEALISKEIKPGDYLPSESELAKGFGVGKSSIREAIKMLEAMGVVEIKRGQGTMICEQPSANTIDSLLFQFLIQKSEIQDIVDLRAMFEIAYTIMAMDCASKEDIKEIEKTIIDFEDKINKGEQSPKDDLKFHYTILNSTHNPYVIRIGESILQLFKNSINKSVIQTPQWALEDHKKIFEAFCKKDSEGIRNSINSSLNRWKENL